MTSADRIATRYLVALELQDATRELADIKATFLKLLLPEDKVARAIKTLESLTKDELGYLASSSDPERKAAWDVALTAFIIYDRMYGHLWNKARPFFRGLLSTYPLKGRTLKAIEKASQLYGKPYRPRVEKHNYVQYLQVYLKWVSLVEETLKAAEAAIHEGERALQGGAPETLRKLNAGSFTVVNAGGFDASTMDRVAALVKAADQALHKHGFASVCYGDIQITNSIAKSNTLAFFNPSTDEIFVRADAKVQGDALRTVLHELGHRLVAKDRGIASQLRVLYMQCQGHQRDHERSSKPADDSVKPGDVLQIKRTRYEAVEVSGGRVRMRKNNDPRPGYSMPVQDWVQMAKLMKDPASEEAYEGGFVTAYAQKGGPEENFCEMLSFYCLGKLKPNQLELFKPVIGAA